MLPSYQSDATRLSAPKLGACTWAYVWRASIEDSLRSLNSLGYEAMDVLTIPPHPFSSEMDPADRRRLAALTRHIGVTIETLNIPSTDVNLCSVNRDMRKFTVDQICQTLELANDL
jgi:L-ribulose-5-phosphate 3-epimerase